MRFKLRPPHSPAAARFSLASSSGFQRPDAFRPFVGIPVSVFRRFGPLLSSLLRFGLLRFNLLRSRPSAFLFGLFVLRALRAALAHWNRPILTIPEERRKNNNRSGPIGHDRKEQEMRKGGEVKRRGGGPEINRRQEYSAGEPQ
jgi:hypothetical protein